MALITLSNATIAFGGPPVLEDITLRIERDERGGRVRGAHGHAAARLEDGMLTVQCRRCVGVTGVAAGSIAGPAVAVVGAARILRHVAAEGALMADLGR